MFLIGVDLGATNCGADRQAAILPVNAPEGGRRVSPLDASRRYLEHIRQAWDHAHEDAPFGMEEGSAAAIPGREFGLVVGEPAEFRFFASAVRKHDAAGEMIDDLGDELTELAPVKVELPAEGAPGGVVRVTLEARVTEVGVLELWSVARDGRRWKLEFQVREKARR